MFLPADDGMNVAPLRWKVVEERASVWMLGAENGLGCAFLTLFFFHNGRELVIPSDLQSLSSYHVKPPSAGKPADMPAASSFLPRLPCG
jgi:hypothetical protein